MANPVKETKAQKVERLKRAMNPWDGLAEIRRFAREGFDFHSGRVDRNLLPLVGSLHAGRRCRRGRRQGRPGTRAAVLHAADSHSQRPSAIRPTAHHRRLDQPLRPRHRRSHGAAKHSVALGHHRSSSGGAGRTLARRSQHDGRLRRCHSQYYRLPGRGRGRGRNLRCFIARARSRSHAGGECRVLQPAAQVQDFHHGMPRLVPLSGDQRCRPDRDPARGSWKA